MFSDERRSHLLTHLRRDRADMLAAQPTGFQDPLPERRDTGPRFGQVIADHRRNRRRQRRVRDHLQATQPGPPVATATDKHPRIGCRRQQGRTR